jgi:hypothetical protein
MNRVLRLARLQITSWPTLLGWPLAIVGVAFVFNLAFFASIGDEIPGDQKVTGGLASIYLVQLVVCAQLMTQVFSFAVGLNATRRTFFLAACVVAGVQSLMFGVLLYGFAAIERATGGWGIKMSFFAVDYLVDGYSPAGILIYTVPLLLMSAIGLFIGVVFKRWGTNGIWTLSVLLIAVVGSVAVLITLQDGWAAVGPWLGDQSPLALLAGWALVPLAALLAGSYTALRRAVP